MDKDPDLLAINAHWDQSAPPGHPEATSRPIPRGRSAQLPRKPDRSIIRRARALGSTAAGSAVPRFKSTSTLKKTA